MAEYRIRLRCETLSHQRKEEDVTGLLLIRYGEPVVAAMEIGEPVVIPSAKVETTASVVLFSKGERLVGEVAKRQAAIERTIMSSSVAWVLTIQWPSMIRYIHLQNLVL